MTERPEAPVVSLYLWFNVGSSHEPEGMYGAAHAIEHMLFKGSERYGLGEAAATIEDFGGDINAYTSFEQTVLHATVMAPKWSQALDVLLDMALRPTFDVDEFKREKQVILEEVRGALGEPDYLIDLEIQSALFPNHGYGRPILGTDATVESLDRDALFAFWKTHYVPNRALLAIAGPIDDTSARHGRRKDQILAPRTCSLIRHRS